MGPPPHRRGGQSSKTLRVRAPQVCRANPAEKGRFIKIILSLLQSNSTAVVYECAVTLVSLSQAPSAIRAAANCFCQLLVSQSDNNVKLIVLDRLHELKNKHREVMQVRRTRRGPAIVPLPSPCPAARTPSSTNASYELASAPPCIPLLPHVVLPHAFGFKGLPQPARSRMCATPHSPSSSERPCARSR